MTEKLPFTADTIEPTERATERVPTDGDRRYTIDGSEVYCQRVGAWINLHHEHLHYMTHYRREACRY